MWKNDQKLTIDDTQDSVNFLIIALEDLNELQRKFVVKNSLVTIKELKAKGNDIKKIIRKVRNQVILLPKECGVGIKNVEYISEQNIDEAIMECIIYDNSKQAEEVIHSMCYTLREFIKKLKKKNSQNYNIDKLSTDM